MTLTELTETVTMRLATFGYTVKTTDESAMTYVVGHAAQYVCNYCNFKTCPDDIPAALKYVTADYAVGEFLQQKKTFAPADLSNLNLDLAIKQITTGDTTTAFATGDGSQTDEQKLNTIISYLMTYGKHDLNSNRKVKW